MVLWPHSAGLCRLRTCPARQRPSCPYTMATTTVLRWMFFVKLMPCLLMGLPGPSECLALRLR